MWRVMWIAAIAACSGKPAPPVEPIAARAVIADAGVADAAPLDRDLPRLVQRSLTMQRDIAAAFTATGNDCAAATAKLGQLAGSYRDIVEANAKVLHDGHADELRAAMAPHSDAFDRAAAAIMQAPTMATCAQQPSFGEAFDALFATP